MKLMWKISHHPFPTTIEDSYYYSPQYTALQPKHPRSSVIPHTAESEVHQYPGCAPMNHTAPCSSRAHSPVPKEEGGFFSSISPRVTRLHLLFCFCSPEAHSGNYSWVCTQIKELPQPLQSHHLFVGWMCVLIYLCFSIHN